MAALREPPAAKALLIALAVGYVALMLLLPLGAVLTEALRKGWQAWWAAVSEPDARASIELTLIVAAISVPLNTIFGIAAAWAISKFDFRGKKLLVTLIDLPFAVSPVVSGLLYVLVYGVHGTFGPWLVKHDMRVIFAVPGK
jgi:sulfate transport system permease protein